ncbi:Ribonuclease HI [Candidatus Enterovibrio escicola]|uniref:Ribonuclease HI n=1 Tax=Candidatus Enterovibrio escicola TaxID=1927127 RepID=A0A2A5T0M4_9GAMM|nr:Ribonuclease HI [Candidatus Enterovibrio escacola]
MWKRLDEESQRHKVNWQWVKSHVGHFENERCDELARHAAEKPIYSDEGYKSNN